MEMIQDLLANPMVMNGIGGAVLGPIIAKILRGGGLTGILGGVLGGIGAGFGADASGLNEVVSNSGVSEMVKDGTALTWIQNLVEGAAGGGVLGGIIGKVLHRN